MLVHRDGVTQQTAKAVTTTSNTKFEETTCAAVVNGVTVEVKGTRTGTNAMTATNVEEAEKN
jgi:hypothetical protein